MLVPGLLGESSKVRYGKKHYFMGICLLKGGGVGCTYMDILDLKNSFQYSTILPFHCLMHSPHTTTNHTT